jgi:hypothetical protein
MKEGFWKTLAGNLGGSSSKTTQVAPETPATAPPSTIGNGFGQGPAAKQDASDKAARNQKNPWFMGVGGM